MMSRSVKIIQQNRDLLNTDLHPKDHTVILLLC